MPLRRIHEALREIERIDALIRRRSTGTPDEMAKKLCISRSTWFEYLNVLRIELEFPIEYDYLNKTYFYEQEGIFTFGFKKTNKKNEI
jgi:hypothetical protein